MEKEVKIVLMCKQDIKKEQKILKKQKVSVIASVSTGCSTPGNLQPSAPSKSLRTSNFHKRLSPLHTARYDVP